MRIEKNKKAIKVISFVTTVLIGTAGFSFDWPQNEVLSDSFHSYFGQLRGGTIESSLIFNEGSEIKSADDGNIIGIISEHDNDFGWFESTLGNAVIINHDNSMITIYGNLDQESIPDNIKNIDESKNNNSNQSSTFINAGTYLGVSGNSGWQQGASCLEFMVLDINNASAINPRILMPRIGNELPLEIGEITLKDRDGNNTILSQSKRVKSGLYSIYKTRQAVAVPYKTSISINGATLETISYDRAIEKNGKLCVSGNSFYSIENLYPDEKKELISQITLTQGKNTIKITVQNIIGGTKTATYVIDVY